MQRALDVSYYRSLGHIRDPSSFRMPCALVKKTGIHPGVLHAMKEAKMLVWAPLSFKENEEGGEGSDRLEARRASRATREQRTDGYGLVTDTRMQNADIV